MKQTEKLFKNYVLPSHLDTKIILPTVALYPNMQSTAVNTVSYLRDGGGGNVYKELFHFPLDVI